MTDFFDIDGSMLEGGGQILRISVSLSAIFVVPIRVYNIRAGRSKPGLAAQHLIGIKLVADMCGARLKGAHIGSTEITFIPSHRIRKGHYVADTRTAGSVSLLLQVALPCAWLADGPVTLDLKGGTNADMAPQIEYIIHIFMKNIAKFGVTMNEKIHRRGYYPRGGGHVTVSVEPVSKFRAVSIVERGDVLGVYGWSFVAGTLPVKLAHQMVEGLVDELSPVQDDIRINTYKENGKTAPDNCSGIIAAFSTSTECVVGADGLGRRGVDAKDVGRGTGSRLRALLQSGACVDNHMQDQLIVYMALAEGKSAMRCGEITLHTRTAIHIAEMISKVKFTIRPEGELNVIECVGIGFLNRHI